MKYFLLHAGQKSAVRLSRRIPQLVLTTDLSAVGEADVVIRFGHGSHADRGYWVINRFESLQNMKSRAGLLKSLHVSGVACPHQLAQSGAEMRVQLQRYYRIPIFNLLALACFRTEEKGVWLTHKVHQVANSFEEVAMDLDEQSRKACLLAVRAVHALGLEFGLVSIGVNHAGRLMVLDISVEPVLKGRLLDLYAAAITDYILRMNTVQIGRFRSLLMGADLEFMLKTRHGKIALASHFFPNSGKVGCDARSMQGNPAQKPLAELRPEPAATPEELCQHISVTLNEATDLLSRQFPTWLAGSAPFPHYPVGGHIHFSGVPFTGHLVNLLDLYVGLPIMLIEDPRTVIRRRPKYGFLGDVRHKPYGGFEYRTPGSFLVDPEIALGALALAYICVLHQATLPLLPFNTRGHVRAFYKGDRDFLLPLAQSVHKELALTATYPLYQEAIDGIFGMIENDEVWDESVDLRTAWDIPVTRHTSLQKRGRVSSHQGDR